MIEKPVYDFLREKDRRGYRIDLNNEKIRPLVAVYKNSHGVNLHWFLPHDKRLDFELIVLSHADEINTVPDECRKYFE